MRLFYQFITIFFYPLIVLIIFLRKISNKEDKLRYKEKIFSSSIIADKNKQKKLIWFHAASIGEVQSIFPVIKRLSNQKKNVEFLITTVTLSSGNLVKKKLGKNKNIKHRYFPIDVIFIINKFLNSWKPDLVIFVDSEVWPNLILNLKKRKIPLMLINARITEKTFKRWMMISNFAKNIFSCFNSCLASSASSKKYLLKLNSKNVKYIGNIKFSVPISLDGVKNTNKKFLDKKRFWCAASIHKEEEILCINTHLKIKKVYKNIVTVIAPRHIGRSKNIKRLCDKLNISNQVLSESEKIRNNKEIIIINAFGVLSEYFKYSKSVFIGKSIIKRLEQVGGQSPIEAAKLGCKIYHGPYTYNFSDIYKFLKKNKISTKINDEKELSKKLILDLKNNYKNNNKKNIKKISNLGEKIFNESMREIDKVLKNENF